MLPHRGLLAGLLFGFLTAAALADDGYRQSLDKEAASDIEEFSKLLEQVDPDSLHAALHDYSPKKFKHGMFKEDRTAVEAIHRDQPSVASTIVAKAKRQDIPTNGTVSTPPADSPSPTTPDPSDTADAPGNTPTDAGPSPNPSAVATPDPIGPVQGSTLEGPSTAPPVSVGGSPSQQPATATSTNTSPDAPDQTTSSGDNQENGQSTSSSAFTGGATPSLTAGQVVTTTNADGITIVSTIGGGYVTLSRSSSGGGDSSSPATTSVRTSRRSSSTSVVLQTTTLPDGSQSTVTAVTVVPGSGDAGPTPTGEAGAGAGAGTSGSGSDPSLQSGVGAVRLGNLGWELVCLLGGAVGVAMMM
ncbi:MAG: hypothetical protein Q9168_007240 [Polycauliona sp. 1 TL-2023]